MQKKLIYVLILLLCVNSVFLQKQASAASNADKIESIAKAYMGVPYVWGGTTPRGFDCSGYVRYVYKEAGVSLPRTSREQFQVGTSVAKEDLKKGDLVFFHTDGRSVSHVGIYLDNNQFINAETSKGVKISSLNNKYWSRYYHGAKRILPDQEEVLPQTLPVEQPKVTTYEDVPSDYWAKNAIQSLRDEGVMRGFDEKLFKPDQVITRADAAIMLANAKHLELEPYKDRFIDVPNDYYAASAIETVIDTNIMGQAEPNQFQPDAPFTRDQLAIAFMQAFNDLPKVATPVTFKDVTPDTLGYAEILWLTSRGIITDFAGDSFKPHASMTRAEFASYLYKATHQ